MSPPSAPTERLKHLSNHLVYSKTTTTTTTHNPDTSSLSTTPDSTCTFIGTPISSHSSPSFKPTSPSSTPSNPTLLTPSSTRTTTMANPPRPAITCHVLDTTLGRPAASIPVTLMSLPSASPPPPSPPPPNTYTTPFSTSTPTIIATGITNSDGRVAVWNYAPLPGHDDDGGRWEIRTERGRVYMLRFETEGYYQRWYGEAGGFFPWVDVVFKMGGGEMLGEDGREEGERKHYHVPVLLSRFGYSTYRGS